MGIIDEALPPESLIPRAREIARQLAAINPATFRLDKRQMREPFMRDAAEISRISAEEIGALWAAPETHERIRAHLAKTIGKRST